VAGSAVSRTKVAHWLRPRLAAPRIALKACSMAKARSALASRVRSIRACARQEVGREGSANTNDQRPTQAARTQHQIAEDWAGGGLGEGHAEHRVPGTVTKRHRGLVGFGASALPHLPLPSSQAVALSQVEEDIPPPLIPLPFSPGRSRTPCRPRRGLGNWRA